MGRGEGSLNHPFSDSSRSLSLPFLDPPRKEGNSREKERPNELQAADGGEEGFILNTAVLFKKIGAQL